MMSVYDLTISTKPTSFQDPHVDYDPAITLFWLGRSFYLNEPEIDELKPNQKIKVRRSLMGMAAKQPEIKWINLTVIEGESNKPRAKVWDIDQLGDRQITDPVLLAAVENVSVTIFNDRGMKMNLADLSQTGDRYKHYT